ncbi:ABC transporter substrate-binding protein [Pseudonocardia halophobica]|uniref:ABC transporter substrate-binding protein n=1 Tax=Pseudonocardia halophobica TaxID=29401 RepID=UPI003D90DCEA
MYRKSSIIKILASVAVGAVALAGCGGGASSGSGGTASGPKAPPSVAIATSGTYITIFAPLWAAKPDLDKVAEKYGTKISFTPFGKGGDAQTALLGGSAQVNAGTSSSDTAEAAAKAQPLVAAANMFTGGGVVLVGAKKYEAERGTDIAKYGGGAWGYTAEGSSSMVASVAIAEHAGLSWADQKGVALGSVAAFEPALQSGRADIVAMDPTSAAKAIANGNGYPVLNTNDAKVFEPVSGTILGNSIVVTDEFRNQYPEFTQAVVTAFISGLNKVKNVTDPNAAYAMMPPEYQKAHPNDAQFANEWALCQPAFAITDGSYSPQAIADTLKTTELTPEQQQSPQIKGLFDNSYVDAAYKELNIPRQSG